MVYKIRKEEARVKEDGPSRKRKGSNSERAGLLDHTISANRLKALDLDEISRCQLVMMMIIIKIRASTTMDLHCKRLLMNGGIQEIETAVELVYTYVFGKIYAKAIFS